jgi:DNA-binding protein H-NS
MASNIRKPKGKPETRFEALEQRHQDVEAVTALTKTLGEAASTAQSQNTLTTPAKNQRADLRLRMLQHHKLVFEAHQYKVWEGTGRRPSLQKMLDEATAIMAFVLSEESGITAEASLLGETLSDSVIRRLSAKPKKGQERK